MASTQKERHCRICNQQIAATRCKTFPTANTCGGEPCAKVMRSRQGTYIAEYLPPAEGTAESADPLFRAKLKTCGYCGSDFTTTAKWRYFCGNCRRTDAVRFPEVERTIPVRYVQRGGA